jgi:hypothetical protein
LGRGDASAIRSTITFLSPPLANSLSPQVLVLGFVAEQNSRQEGRLENQVADQKAIDAEKYEADVDALTIQLEKQNCQRPQLFHLECVQVLAASQDDKRGELKEAGESQNGATHKAEERRE